jgi:hypothetical protein
MRTIAFFLIIISTSFQVKRFDINDFKIDGYALIKSTISLPKSFNNDIFYNDEAIKKEFAYFNRKDKIKGFNITIVHYKSRIGSFKKFHEIEKLKNEEKSLFAKDWGVLVVKGNQIFSLRGGCMFSEKSWGQLQNLFFNKIHYEKNIDKKINYRCGDDF